VKRLGVSLILRPLSEKPHDRSHRLADSLPVLEGRLANPAMTFRREEK